MSSGYVRPTLTVFSPEDRENFKNAFDAFDEDRDDLCSVEILGKLIRAIGFNPLPEEVEDMQQDINSATFDFNTFLYLVYRHAREADPEAELIESFRVFDKDGNGELPVATIRKILSNLKQPFTGEQIEQLLEKANVVRDKISYKEFVPLMLDF
jgi:Ca2+-binding EF-hand superfamily protein